MTTNVERVDLAPGYSISRIINGCWQLTPDHGSGPSTEAEVHRIFAELVEYGFTTFDCADIYVGVEESLGRFSRSLAPGSEIQVHTKYAPDKATLRDLTDQSIDNAIDRSLRRLNVERLDLLQFHWWNYDVPGIEKVIQRLSRAQVNGKIRLLGLTNFDSAHVREIVDSGARIVSLQAQYSLLDRRPERSMSELSTHCNVKLLSYGALAGGFIGDNYLGVDPPHDMNRSLQKYRLIIEEAGGWTRFQDLLSTLAEVARRHESTIATVALRWVLDQTGVAAVILGTGHKSRAEQNAKMFELALDSQDRQEIATVLATLDTPAGDMYDLERVEGGRHAGIIRTELHDAVDIA